MRKFFGYVITVLALIGVVSVAVAQQRVVPYAANPDEPYGVAAQVTSGADGGFTVHVKITEKKTGAVVYAPRVHFGPRMPNMHAEAFSDPVEGRPQFDVEIDVDARGKATITFRAFDHLVQASSAQAMLAAAEPGR